ncbi:MAG TPA: GTPase HflX [Candidatus Onthenecus intestinigallinarum]|uniref:GTPase HflX n=1 Tax=Candidatus Onthenecus intestinigallinarum TaxID=2840875 RepID=A0A9D1CQF3_9FIRM|nr:GTPase HflX [Candidatus Onthenecus intestinigallinarum]
MFLLYGNTQGIRDSLLAEIETLYETPIEEGEFAPVDLLERLARYTCLINREISVYISRSGEVLDVTIGGLESVPLKDMHLRRNARRLSMIRCIHTHPGGDARLSDVDISSLRTLRFDAMAAVGARDGKPTGVQAAFLGECKAGVPQEEVTDVVGAYRIPQRAWMEEILRSDARVLQGEPAPEAGGPERAYLVGLDSEASLQELARLAETAGAKVVGSVLQRRARAEGATYVGSGKAEEIALDCQALDVDLAIFDDELTGAQTRNLENILGVKVVDRTALILDIFAQRAQSREGRLQVELAQMNYQLPRLIGHGLSMSRLGGGIGTRGPGETRLEVDRRRIRKRMTDLRREIDDLRAQRSVRRARRERNAVPVVALVGYTNAGKSTLLNRLTEAGVMAEDKLFATLDPVTRSVRAPQGGEFLLVDTVGFISKLPHALVDAFRSTLEEAALADLLVVVSDASSEQVYAQRDVVRDVLASLGAQDKPVIDALNKADAARQLPDIPGGIPISAKRGDGVDALLEAISAQLLRLQRPVWLMVPYARTTELSRLHDENRVLEERYEAEGTRVRALVDDETLARLVRALGPDAVCEGVESAQTGTETEC